ncbi:MAG: LLM class flavin-dependent oxidoreductase [Anaerolineae bacterium]
MPGPAFTILHHLDGDPLERPSRQVYAEVMEHVVLADQLGFETIWFAEHHAAQGGRLPWPLLFIIAAAERTRRVTLGTGVTLIPFYHPLAVAEQIAEADILTGGRFAVGFGSGSAPGDFGAFGVPPALKGERLQAGLEVLLRLWAGETVTERGSHYDISGARLFPLPERPAREIGWLAAGHPFTATMAGAHDLHLMLARGTPTKDAQALIAAYRAALAAHGHTAADRRIQRTWMVYVAETDAAARAAIVPSAAFYYQQYLATGRPRLADEANLDAVLALIDCIVGSPATVARELAARAGELGLTDIALHTRMAAISHAETLRSTQLLAERVFPRVQELWPEAVAS